MVKVTDRKKRLHKQKILKKIKFYVFLFLILILLGGVVWVIFFSPLFEIKKINLSGEDPGDATAFTSFLDTTIESRSWLNMKPFYTGFLRELSYNDKNSLFQNFGALESGFKENFPEYSDSQINFNWWNQTLSLSVSKRVLAALWCDESKCGLVDENGIYFKDLTISDKQALLQDPDYTNYFLLEGQFKGTSQPVVIGSLVVSPETIKDLKNWYDNCKGNIIGYREIFLSDSSLECFSAITTLGMRLTFNPASNVSEVLRAIKELQTQTKSNSNWQGLTSMNFCFYPKIYYTPDGFFNH